MVDRKERGGFEWQRAAAIGSNGTDVTRMEQGAFWSDVTVNIILNKRELEGASRW